MRPSALAHLEADMELQGRRREPEKTPGPAMGGVWDQRFRLGPAMWNHADAVSHQCSGGAENRGKYLEVSGGGGGDVVSIQADGVGSSILRSGGGPSEDASFEAPTP